MFIEENMNNVLVFDLGSAVVRAELAGESRPSFYSPINPH
jgi:hypothetical protein